MRARWIPILGFWLMALAPGALPVRAADGKAVPSAPWPQVHPKVFSMFQGWLSDGESPVVTEVNVEAIAASRNQFDPESMKLDDGWMRCAGPDGGFMRYRVLASQGQRFTVEYQENGGGSLTTSTIFDVSLEKREIRKDGRLATIRVLRVLSCRAK